VRSTPHAIAIVAAWGMVPLAAIALITAVAIGQRGREDISSWLHGRQPLESGRYCNTGGECWDIERADPAPTLYRVTPGGARIGDGIHSRPSPYREWDFEIDHGPGRLQFLVLSPRTISARARVGATTGDPDTYGRR
jgi:hypothetical protein